MKYRECFKNQMSHREFRLSMAASAIKAGSYTRTLKFPLEEPESGWRINFDFARQLFNTTEGVGKGSLIGFQFCLMLSGFRLFSKSGETQLFRSQAKLPMAEFEKSFKKAFSQRCNNFTPSGLIAYFSAEKRTYNKQKTALTEEMLAGELYRLATTKLPEKDKKLNAELLEVCALIAKQICAQINQWRELAEHVGEALKAVDAALAIHGHSFPQIANCTEALQPLTPENSTIDFDAHAPVVDELSPDLMPYQVVACQSILLRREVKDVDKKSLQGSSAVVSRNHTVREVKDVDKKSLQGAITTANNNALSWLFGTGLKLWQSSSVEELCEMYKVPKTRHYLVTRAKEWAEAIEADRLYGDASYAKYRSAVGGKLDSWIANYSRRLSELDEVISEMTTESLQLPEALMQSEHARLMSGSALSAQQLQALMDTLNERKLKTQGALEVLQGKQERLPQTQDIEEFHLFGGLISDISGEIEVLNNRLQQEQEKATTKGGKSTFSVTFKKPAWLKDLPKVTALSGGVPDYQQEVKEAVKQYHSLSLAYFSQVEILTKAPEWGCVLLATRTSEAQRLKDHPRFTEFDITELAQRNLLDKYLRVVSKGPVELKKAIVDRMLEAQLPLPVNDDHVQDQDKSAYQHRRQQASLNELVMNGKGRVYVSPYSRGRHQPWALEPSALPNIDLFEWIELDLQWLQEHFENNLAEKHRLMLDWRILRARLQLLTLPEAISTSIFNKDLISQLNLPSVMQAQLRQETLNRDLASKVLNLCLSEMRGLQALIFREGFFLRTRFSRIDDNQIWYVPKRNEHKKWEWKVPPQLLRSSKPIVEVVQKHKQDNDDIVIESLKQLAKQEGKQWARSSGSVGALLRQMPHDWYLNLGFSPSFDFAPLEAVALDKKKLGKPKQANQLCRLQGSTAFKGWLDKQLVQSDITIGDYTLIIEQHFKQTIAEKDGSLVVSVTPSPAVNKNIGQGGLKLEVALPVTQQVISDKVDFSQTYIGIDLGEAGIGYAVVCSKTHEVITADSIPIRSVKNLIRAVKHHRKNKQPAQKFTQRFDTSLMKLRENAVGDICHVINSLMAHYHGVPILESTVGNLASGAKQLQLVYDKVLHLYLYSNIDAHKKARTHFWCGSDSWTHAFAKETVKKYGTKKLIERELQLFPGSGVHPAGTSQRCSHCGRNPYALLDVAYAETKRISTDENGLLDLGEVKLRFVSAQMDEKKWKLLAEHERKELLRQRAALKRQNQRPPMKYPVPSKSFTLEEAKRQLRRQLRRAPESLRSKDTTQSQYFCAIEGCGHHMHADVNAAINIVFKWIKDRKITHLS
ncbi:type V CRISPR-associated protein Cas12c [Vibrio sp. PNB22_4_1]